MTNYCRNKQVKHPKNIQKTLKSFGCNFFPVGYYFYLKLNWFSGKMCALMSIFLKSLCWYKNHKFLVIKANVKNHYCRKWKKDMLLNFSVLFIKSFGTQFFGIFSVSVLRVFTWMGRGSIGGGGTGQKAHRCLSLLFVSPHPHTLPNTGYQRFPFGHSWFSTPFWVFSTLVSFLILFDPPQVGVKGSPFGERPHQVFSAHNPG